MIRVWYHQHCHDGAAAAWAARIALADAATYHPAQYGRAVPPFDPGDEIILVDFSLPRDALRALCAEASSVLVLDHHKSAIKQLTGLEQECGNLTLCLAPHRSGAALTWHWFHAGDPPHVLQHVEDRDLWRFHLPYTAEVHAALDLIDRTPEDWHATFGDDPDAHLDILIERGRLLLQAHERRIERVIAHAAGSIGYIDGHAVPLLNLPPDLASDALHRILEQDATLRFPFAASYVDLPHEGVRRYELRSTDDRLDVAEIAQRFDGGGHRNAAGFRLSLERDDVLPGCELFDRITGTRDPINATEDRPAPQEAAA